MAVLTALTASAMADAITTYMDVGSGTACLKFESTNDAEIATCDMNATKFNSAVCGVITAGTIVDDTSATGGTVAQVSMYNDAGTKVAEFSCGTGSEEFQISSVTIGAGDTVGVSAFTITVPQA